MSNPTDARPTAPGWYWARIPNALTIGGDAWECVHVVYNRWDVELEPEGDLGVCEVDHGYPLDISDRAFDGREWMGPITPDDVAELALAGAKRDIAIFAKGNTIIDPARMRASGDALVAVAKEAVCTLDGEANAPLRTRLCDAIADWLGLEIRPGEGDSTGD